jgi:hypothetical protein
MAKIQKRRAVSLSSKYYEALKTHAEQLGVPLVSIIELAVFPVLRDAGLLRDDEKIRPSGKYWDPQVKRWRVPATNSRFAR